MSMPLSGVRVIDMGRLIAAPSATQMLGDLGAEVIKLERPGEGDDSRTYGPSFLESLDGKSTLAGFYLAQNRNKKSMTLDFAKPEGAQIVRELAADADVFVENYKVGDLARRGLDYESLKKINPRLVYCSVTGFGQSGPYSTRPGVDSVFQAMSGLMSVTGEPDRAPQKVGLTLIDMITGIYTSTAILAALRHRDATGHGQAVSVSLLDAAVAIMSHRAVDYLVSGEIPHRSGTASAGTAPAQHFQCKDGEINVQAGGDRQFGVLCRALGRPDMITRPQYLHRMDRWGNKAELIAELQAIFANDTVMGWCERLQPQGVICGPVNNLAQTFQDPQVIHNGIAMDMQHPDYRPTRLLRNPIKFSDTPIENYGFPPVLGENTDEILSDILGYSPEKIAALKEAGVV
jgi:crotonobetainyl-CoA:carnitine CoA-transferase CaiB-like acyl-CoA transferase